MESHQFRDEERGGLLMNDRYGDNTLHYLVTSYHPSHGGEYNQRVDTVCRSQLIQLRQMDLFMEEDIPRYELVHNLICQDYFAERRLQFLVEWDPSSLVHTNEYGSSPLHYAACAPTIIQAFRIVFEYLIRYYPNKTGMRLLFQKDNANETPFQLACEKYGREVVMRIVEDTLNNSVIPLNIVEAVVMAAIDGNVHLDCVYFLLRREPDVLVRLLSEPHNNNNNKYDDDDDDGGGGEDDHNNDGDTVNDKNEKDKDDDNDGDHVDNDNHDGEEDDDDKDEGDEDEVGSEDS